MPAKFIFDEPEFKLDEQYLFSWVSSLQTDKSLSQAFTTALDRRNIAKSLEAIASENGLEPVAYRKRLSKIYKLFQKHEGVIWDESGSKLSQLRKYVWGEKFDKWLEQKTYLLLCKRSNERRGKLEYARTKDRERLLGSFKQRCVVGKLDKLEYEYNLCTSHSFLYELERTLKQAVEKYRFKDRNSLEYVDSNIVVEWAIIKVRNELRAETKLIVILENIRDAIMLSYELIHERRENNRRDSNEIRS